MNVKEGFGYLSEYAGIGAHFWLQENEADAFSTSTRGTTEETAEQQLLRMEAAAEHERLHGAVVTAEAQVQVATEHLASSRQLQNKAVHKRLFGDKETGHQGIIPLITTYLSQFNRVRSWKVAGREYRKSTCFGEGGLFPFINYACARRYIRLHQRRHVLPSASWEKAPLSVQHHKLGGLCHPAISETQEGATHQPPGK
jgi:hypothetical protein